MQGSRYELGERSRRDSEAKFGVLPCSWVGGKTVIAEVWPWRAKFVPLCFRVYLTKRVAHVALQRMMSRVTPART